MPPLTGPFPASRITTDAFATLQSKIALSRHAVFNADGNFQQGDDVRIGSAHFRLVYQVTAHTSWPSSAARGDLDAFAQKYLEAPTDLLAAKINGILASLKVVVFAPLVLPDVPEVSAARVSEAERAPLRLLLTYDIKEDCTVARFDVLFGGI